MEDRTWHSWELRKPICSTHNYDFTLSTQHCITQKMRGIVQNTQVWHMYVQSYTYGYIRIYWTLHVHTAEHWCNKIKQLGQIMWCSTTLDNNTLDTHFNTTCIKFLFHKKFFCSKEIVWNWPFVISVPDCISNTQFNKLLITSFNSAYIGVYTYSTYIRALTFHHLA